MPIAGSLPRRILEPLETELSQSLPEARGREIQESAQLHR